MEHLKIQKIEFESDEYDAAFQLRESHLRLPLGLSLSIEDLMGEKDQEHFLLIDETDTIIGCLIIRPLEAGVAQLRQMVIIGKKQGHGAGKKFLQLIEKHLKDNSIHKIFLDARVEVRAFYQKSGYKEVGTTTKKVSIPHIRMEKEIGK